VLVVVHVYYPQMWSELLMCIRNVGAADMVVTYVDEAAVTVARQDLPNAVFLRCENRGYDVWPFLKAVGTVRLDDYDVVVKLHTKRDVESAEEILVGNTCLNGPRWRDHLLAFVRTPRAWRKALTCLGRGRTGMVADRHVIFGRRDATKDIYRLSFDRAVALLDEKWGLKVRSGASFVGGTMFAVRAELLRPFVRYPFTAEMFDVSAGHSSETLAHVLERMMGLAISAQGYRVAAFNGSVLFRRLRYAVLHFLYQNRKSDRRHSIRLCCITVYRKKLCA